MNFIKTVVAIFAGIFTTLYYAIRPSKDISYEELVDHDYHNRKLRYRHPDIKYTETPQEFKERMHKMHLKRQKLST